MTDKQLGALYVVLSLLFIGLYVAVDAVVSKPMGAENYADKLCQELYGPHTQYYWSDKGLQCLTARGELLPVRMK